MLNELEGLLGLLVDVYIKVKENSLVSFKVQSSRSSSFSSFFLTILLLKYLLFLLSLLHFKQPFFGKIFSHVYLSFVSIKLFSQIHLSARCHTLFFRTFYLLILFPSYFSSPLLKSLFIGMNTVLLIGTVLIFS